MQKTLFSFLMVGLAFTAFQVGVVEAQQGGSGMAGGNSMQGGNSSDSAKHMNQGNPNDHMNSGQQEGFRDPSFVEGDVNSGKCGKPVCPQ